MSVREEDRRKNNCPSRGLGLAAAAIGVGVGAALYYFFSKRPNPDTEGSTSENWTCEQQQSFNITTSPKSEYTTISEHTTTDTSIWATDNDNNSVNCRLEKRIKCNLKKRKKVYSSSSNSSCASSSTMDSSFEDYNDNSCCGCCDSSSAPDSEDEYTVTDTEMSNEESVDDDNNESIDEVNDSIAEESQEDDSHSGFETEYDTSLETGYITLRTTSSNSNNRQDATSDSDLDNEWDITSSSADVADFVPNDISFFVRNILSRLTGPRIQNETAAEDEQTRLLRERAFRERRWSLEECAICFEVMLKDQPLMQLPCTHNFHVACIGPWLQEQQTCPMCRKAAE